VEDNCIWSEFSEISPQQGETTMIPGPTCPKCGSTNIKLDTRPIDCKKPNHILCFRYLRCENCGSVIIGSIHNFVANKELHSTIEIPERVGR